MRMFYPDDWSEPSSQSGDTAHMFAISSRTNRFGCGPMSRHQRLTVPRDTSNLVITSGCLRPAKFSAICSRHPSVIGGMSSLVLINASMAHMTHCAKVARCVLPGLCRPDIDALLEDAAS